MSGNELARLKEWLTGLRGQIETLERGLAEYTAPPDEKLPAKEQDDIAHAQEMCARKKRYHTPQGAGAAAEAAHAKGSTDALRIYPCIVCGGYHLTHLALDRHAGVE